MEPRLYEVELFPEEARTLRRILPKGFSFKGIRGKRTRSRRSSIHKIVVSPTSN